MEKSTSAEVSAGKKTGSSAKAPAKAGRYLKYAIGEIILVVIGILIALQINNFNEHRKDKIKEQVILKQLKEDYQVNLIQLEQKMQMRDVIVKSALKIFNDMDNPDEIIRDSLIINIANIDNDPTFDPIKSDLIGSGNIRLIENEKLKRLLSNYTSDIVAVKELEEIWSNKMNQQLEPLIGKMGISREVANIFLNESRQTWLLDDNANAIKTAIGNSKKSVSVNEIINNRELEGLVSEAITYNQPANVQSEGLVKRINEIIDLIDSEIIEK